MDFLGQDHKKNQQKGFFLKVGFKNESFSRAELLIIYDFTGSPMLDTEWSLV